MEQEFEFSDGVNLIYGKNAQGKTNITEAVWMFTGARSFRGSKDIDLVIERTAKTVANGINLALHRDMTLRDVESYVG